MFLDLRDFRRLKLKIGEGREKIIFRSSIFEAVEGKIIKPYIKVEIGPQISDSSNIFIKGNNFFSDLRRT